LAYWPSWLKALVANWAGHLADLYASWIVFHPRRLKGLQGMCSITMDLGLCGIFFFFFFFFFFFYVTVNYVWRDLDSWLIRDSIVLAWLPDINSVPRRMLLMTLYSRRPRIPSCEHAVTVSIPPFRQCVTLMPGFHHSVAVLPFRSYRCRCGWERKCWKLFSVYIGWSDQNADWLSVCNTVHCGAKSRCRGLKVVPSCS